MWSAAGSWSINLKEVRTLGTSQGGEYLDGIRFTYEGGQIRSLLSLLSYFGKGEMRERSFGIKIPPTNLKRDFNEPAHAFANGLAEKLRASQQLGEGSFSPAYATADRRQDDISAERPIYLVDHDPIGAGSTSQAGAGNERR